MIKGLALTNFKSIGKTLILNDDGEPIEGKLEFSPLTIFCGKNSSGKSTVLQSILLMTQTLKNNIESQTFVLNGPMVKLGSINEIKSEFSNRCDNNIEIDIGLIINKPVEKDCIEEEIYVKKHLRFIKYHLSNHFDSIIEILKGYSYETIINYINLNTDLWFENGNLPEELLDLMIKYNKKYSLSSIINVKNGETTVELNEMRDNKCFTFIIKPFTSDFFEELLKSNKIIEDEINTLENNDPAILKNYQNINFKISFCKKDNIPTTDIVPHIDKIHINIPDVNKSIKAISKDIPIEIITEDKNFNLFDLEINDGYHNIDNKIKPEGFRLFHFLPIQYVYLINVNDFKTDTIINLHISKYLNIEYDFSSVSVNQFNESISDFLTFLSDEMSDISIYEKFYSIFKLPDDVIIIDGNTFRERIVECIDRINKSGIKNIISNHYHTVDNNYNQSNKLNPELHKNYKYPYKIVPDSLTPYIYESLDYIVRYFQNHVLYIGPLREEPHLIYSDYIDNIVDIGIKGEKCAAVLYHSSKKTIPAINPFGKWKSIVSNLTYDYLSESVNQWLRYLEIADEIYAEFNTRHGYELKIKVHNNKKTNNLTNVGVGVSQILPIILSCLLAPQNSTIIIEQPELHLHPAMQSKLAEFFISISQTGRQLIIETHSEHIINAIRYYIAEAISPDDETIANDTQIYFVDKNVNGSFFNSIKLDKYANISDWPEGFFDESQINNIKTLKAINNKIKFEERNNE